MGVADAAGQYLPASHAVQESTVAPRVPRYVPGSQFVGTVMPAVLQRVPGGHCRQAACDVAPADAEYRPAEQGSGVVVPSMQYLPAGQVSQLVLTSALCSVRYVPAGHNTGIDVAAGQYRPVGHARHSFACSAPEIGRAHV